MNNYIYLYIFTMILTSNLEALQPVQYWNNNVKKPKSSIIAPLSLRDKCNQTLAMIKERKTVNLEKSVPLLMKVLTKEIHTMPDPPLKEIDITAKKIVCYLFENITVPITTGPSHELFNTIISKQDFLQAQNFALNKPCLLYNFILHYQGAVAQAFFDKVTLTSDYFKLNDASQLFIMHHELQHHFHGDLNTRYFSDQSALSNLVQTPYVRSILKSHIKSDKGQNLQEILEKNGALLQKETQRYKEYSADLGALHSIDCPYCIQEMEETIPDKSVLYDGITIQEKLNKIKKTQQKNFKVKNVYNPDGYLYAWQLQPRIKKLHKKGMICQHHHENGCQVDTSISDGSTLMKRLQIIQKK